MRPLFYLSLLLAVLYGCQQKSTSQDGPKSQVIDSLSFPFTPKYSIHWQPGDEHNAQLVLNCLKKYVDGDIKGCVAYFADTAGFKADKFNFWGSRDSLETLIASMRSASTKVSKNFDSWMTLYYPDKQDTWVTLWYTEIMTDKNGKTDSVYYTDDVLVKNGKIVLYDEKQRLFH